MAVIAEILNDAYYNGIYEGDIKVLGSTFYEGALLYGDVKGQPYQKMLAQYLDEVKNRQSPRAGHLHCREREAVGRTG